MIRDSEHGKPIRIPDAKGEFWTFDKDGQIAHDLVASVIRRLELWSERRKEATAEIDGFIVGLQDEELLCIR